MTPQRYTPGVGGPHPLALRECADGNVVLFADVEEALRDTDRLAWVMPIIDGSPGELADRRSEALCAGVMLGKTGRDLVDYAREGCPE